MKIYTKITIDIDTGKTVEEESFVYNGPVMLLMPDPDDGPGQGPGDDPGEGPNGPDWPDDDSDKSSSSYSSDEEDDSYQKMLEMFYEIFQAINTGAYNQTGQLVGGRGNVGSEFSYIPQSQKDSLSMQLASFAPWMEDYKWNNPQATDDDDDNWFSSLFDTASIFGLGKVFGAFD